MVATGDPNWCRGMLDRSLRRGRGWVGTRLHVVMVRGAEEVEPVCCASLTWNAASLGGCSLEGRGAVSEGSQAMMFDLCVERNGRVRRRLGRSAGLAAR